MLPSPTLPITLGAATFGSSFWKLPADVCRQTIHTALDAGIRDIDTAPLYGSGRAEWLIGQVLAAREGIRLSSKVGRVVSWSRQDPLRFPEAAPAFAYDADAVRRSVAGSLERLGVDRLDIAYIHDPEGREAAALTQALPALRRLQAEGVIGAVGVASKSTATLTRLVQQAPLDCIMLAGSYTLLDQSAIDHLLPACTARGVPVMLGAPFNSGFLALGSSSEARFDYQPPPPHIRRRLSRLEAVARWHGVSLLAATLRLSLSHPSIAAVVPGACSPEQIRQTIAAASADIPSAFWRDLHDQELLDPACGMAGRVRHDAA